MIKRIVMMEGGVETLSYFSHQMAGEFQKLGYAVFFYDLKQEESSAGKLRKFIRPRETVLVTFNFQGLEKEAGVYREGIGYLWDTYHIPCYNIAADHPYFYDDRLKDLPEKYRHISIDRRQKAYFEEFYPEYVSRGFLPLAGTGLRQAEEEGEAEPLEARAQGAAVETGEAGAQGAAEQAAPCYDVILTGNYTKLSFFEPYINWINEEYAAFYRGIIDDLLEHPACTVEEVALAHCEREMGKEPNDQLRIALHKMIRLFTLSGGGEAYLNFMGNEFGHPEWIDFPREGNGWSFHYCRRQWSLKDNGMLKYQWLGDFDEDMVRLTKENRIFDQRMADLLLMKAPEQTLAYYRHGLVFVFNFHFGNSLNNVLVPVRQPGEYTVVLSTDDEKYGGFGNVAKKTYATKRFDGRDYIELYIPARTGFVLKEKVILPETPAAPKKAAK